jgi:hypothetical protein
MIHETYIHTYIHTGTYIHTYTLTYIHINIHTYTHTYILSRKDVSFQIEMLMGRKKYSNFQILLLIFDHS